MRNPKVIGVIAVSVVLFIAILRFTVFAPAPNDRKLIIEALNESIQASKEGRPGGVLDLLSQKFKINESSPGSRMDIAKFIRDSKPDVEIANENPIVSGDSARIDTPVRVKVDYLNQKMDVPIDNVTLVFQRESGRKYLFIPETRWRLTDVLVPNNAIPVNIGDDGGFGGYGGLGF